MKYALITWFLALSLSSSTVSASPQAQMIAPGKKIVSLDFDRKSDVSKQWFSFRKETAYRVEDGALHVIPPAIANTGKDKTSQWGDSDFARAGLVGLPKDYVCEFRWKCNEPTDSKLQEKGLIYIDLGHRTIRVTMSKSGTTLLLENHLMGRKAKISSKVLDTGSELKLEYDKWYDTVAEVKGNEVLIQIGEHLFYGKDDLISGDRYDTFNLDANGAGFQIDRIEVRATGDYRKDWNAKRGPLER